MARLLFALALTVIAGLALRHPLPSLRLLGLALAGGLLITVALTGHAQLESGAAGLLHRAADAVHLLAAATWIGALPPLLLLLGRPALGQAVERPYAAARHLQAFHAIGVTAVFLLVATGAINSWFLVGSVDRLLTTPYGWLLLTKLALFAVMVALAADNRLRLVPALARDLAQGRNIDCVLIRLRGHIRGELILGLLLLLVVAALGTIAPA